MSTRTTTNIHPENDVMPLEIHYHAARTVHPPFRTLVFGNGGTVTVFVHTLDDLAHIGRTIVDYCQSQVVTND